VSSVALALVLAAAVLHASWNRLLHGADDRLAAAAVGAALGAVLLLPATIAVPPLRVWPLAIASGAAEATYFAFLSAAYRRGELSFTYPVARGIAPFLITLGGAAVLGESLTAARVCGSLALGVGLAIISHAGLAKGRGPALMFAALTGITIAIYSVIDADAVRSANALGYLGAVTLVQAILLLGLVRLDSGHLSQLASRLRASARAGAGIGVGSLAAYLLVLLAYQRAPASPVATIRELSILLGILMAQERPGWRVWAGGALCVLGAALTVL
jgi:drug/metabolite transporter (DMT)-like permease